MAYADEYGTVQKLLHWLVALLVVGQVGARDVDRSRSRRRTRPCRGLVPAA